MEDNKKAKRPISSVACTSCQRRHNKCNGLLPCDQCIRRGSDVLCQYAQPKKRGKKLKPEVPDSSLLSQSATFIAPFNGINTSPLDPQAISQRYVFSSGVQSFTPSSHPSAPDSVREARKLADFWKKKYLAEHGKLLQLQASALGDTNQLLLASLSSPMSPTPADSKFFFYSSATNSGSSSSEKDNPLEAKQLPSSPSSSPSSSSDCAESGSNGNSSPSPSLPADRQSTVSSSTRARINYKAMLMSVVEIISMNSHIDYQEAINFASEWSEEWEDFTFTKYKQRKYTTQQLARAFDFCIAMAKACELLAPDHSPRFQQKAELLYHILFFHEGAQANPQLAEKLFVNLSMLYKLFLGHPNMSQCSSIVWMSYILYLNNKNKIKPEQTERMLATLSAIVDSPIEKNRFLSEIDDLSFTSAFSAVVIIVRSFLQTLASSSPNNSALSDPLSFLLSKESSVGSSSSLPTPSPLIFPSYLLDFSPGSMFTMETLLGSDSLAQQQLPFSPSENERKDRDAAKEYVRRLLKALTEKPIPPYWQSKLLCDDMKVILPSTSAFLHFLLGDTEQARALASHALQELPFIVGTSLSTGFGIMLCFLILGSVDDSSIYLACLRTLAHIANMNPVINSVVKALPEQMVKDFFCVFQTSGIEHTIKRLHEKYGIVKNPALPIGA